MAKLCSVATFTYHSRLWERRIFCLHNFLHHSRATLVKSRNSDMNTANKPQQYSIKILFIRARWRVLCEKYENHIGKNVGHRGSCWRRASVWPLHSAVSNKLPHTAYSKDILMIYDYYIVHIFLRKLINNVVNFLCFVLNILFFRRNLV